ncbi:hypothetical protein AMTR_s00112p00021200 [Amborella trichopoda]|uniref:Uncharacterized protein n=1 Tax=Amborella trichopoda TaxID=13333 RepID=W1NWS9_AMBTC|nr:hypothetical protein AMTR_s00112p00021200 [Amborella trichopoda]
MGQVDCGKKKIDSGPDAILKGTSGGSQHVAAKVGVGYRVVPRVGKSYKSSTSNINDSNSGMLLNPHLLSFNVLQHAISVQSGFRIGVHYAVNGCPQSGDLNDIPSSFDGDMGHNSSMGCVSGAVTSGDLVSLIGVGHGQRPHGSVLCVSAVHNSDGMVEHVLSSTSAHEVLAVEEGDSRIVDDDIILDNSSQSIAEEYAGFNEDGGRSIAAAVSLGETCGMTDGTTEGATDGVTDGATVALSNTPKDVNVQAILTVTEGAIIVISGGSVEAAAALSNSPKELPKAPTGQVDDEPAQVEVSELNGDGDGDGIEALTIDGVGNGIEVSNILEESGSLNSSLLPRAVDTKVRVDMGVNKTSSGNLETIHSDIDGDTSKGFTMKTLVRDLQ